MEKHVQSIILEKKHYPKAADAVRWLKAHGYRHELDEKTHTWRARQLSPSEFKTFSNKKIGTGLEIVLGWNDPSAHEGNKGHGVHQKAGSFDPYAHYKSWC